MSVLHHAENPWVLSGMAALNTDLEAPFQGFLTRLVADPVQHAQFLNMLSLLEHIGSRKIMLSQMGGSLGREVLKHMAEETRHAYFFKNQAERLLKQGATGYGADDCLCREAATMYFGRLDAAITQSLPGSAPALPYLWVSLIVELRANWVYDLYQAVLVETGQTLSLKSILAEEAGHMRDMYADIHAADPEAVPRLAGFARHETLLFRRFWAQLDDTAALAA